MSTNRIKKYKQRPIPAAFSEKGGFSAHFISDGYTVDAEKEILPEVIRANGIQVSPGVAWDLVNEFLKACAQRSASTGETVTVGSLLTFSLGIKGWYANKDSKAKKDNVRITATLLGDLRPTVDFSMSNVNEGETLTLVTVMSEGCSLGVVKQNASFTVNGKWLKMLEGDTVTASVKGASGETVQAECPILESDDDHVTCRLPAAFNDAALVGREIAFMVASRCGDPEAGRQTRPITGTLAAGEIPAPDPVDPPEIYLVQCADEPEGKIHAHGDFTVDGAHLADGALALLDADGRVIATPTNVVPTDARISARLDYDGDVSLVKTVKVTTPGGTATMNVRVLA